MIFLIPSFSPKFRKVGVETPGQPLRPWQGCWVWQLIGRDRANTKLRQRAQMLQQRVVLMPYTNYVGMQGRNSKRDLVGLAFARSRPISHHSAGGEPGPG